MAWVLLVIIADVSVLTLRSMVGSSPSEKWFEIVYVSVLLIMPSAAEPSLVEVSEPEPEMLGWV